MILQTDLANGTAGMISLRISELGEVDDRLTTLKDIQDQLRYSLCATWAGEAANSGLN